MVAAPFRELNVLERHSKRRQLYMGILWCCVFRKLKIRERHNERL
jgi:hypothetical protein